MANTVNLVVRVTDGTRAGFAAVNQSLRDLRARTMAAGQSGGALQSVFSRLSTAASTLRGHLTQTNTVGGRFQSMIGLMRNGLTNVRDAFDRSRRSGVSFQSMLGNLRNGFSRVTSAMSDNKGMIALIAGGWLLLGPAAGILAAALTVGLAAGFIGLGAAALKGDAQVKSAFASLKTTVTSTIQQAAQPLKPFLIDGMNQLAAAAKQAGPALSQAFSLVGPMIQPVISGITNLGKNAMPGLLTALGNAGPAMSGFSSALGSVGQGIGDMFAKMTKDPQALKNIWLEIGSGVDTLLGSLGNLMGTAASSGVSLALLKGVFGTVNAVVGALTLSIEGLDKVTFGIFDGLKTNTDTSTKSVSELNKALEDNAKKLAAAQKNNPAGPAGDDTVNKLLKERSKLEADLATASKKAATATTAETKSVQSLMDAMVKLNDKVRNSLDAQAGMEQAIDDASAAAKKGANSLSMHSGQLDLNSQKSRDSYNALSQLAAKTEDAANKARAGGASWETVNGIWDRGRSSLIASAQAMGLNKDQAAQLADQILKTPDKTVRISAQWEDAESGLKAVQAAIKATPGAKSVKVAALTSGAITALKSIGYKVESLPDGSFRVTANTGTASSHVSDLQGQIDALHGKSVPISVYYPNGQVPGQGTVLAPGKATGGIIGAFANGGVAGTRGSLALVGEQGPELVRLPVGSTVYPAGQSRQMMQDGETVRAYAKGGKVTASEKQARSAAVSELTVSYFGKAAGRKTDEFVGAVGSPDTVSSLVDSLNKWRSSIKAATSGVTESRLLKQLKNGGDALLKNQKALEKVNTALASAKDKLASLKDAASQLSDSVKSGIMSGGNITKAAGNGNITAQDVVGQLAGSRDNAKALADALKKLKARGLNSQSLSEIAQAGVDGGGLQTASALLSGSASQIKEINSLEKQLTASATSAGKVTADAMYGAGIKAAQGLVAGLQKQQDKLEKVMENVAKSLERSIKKAFGIKASGGIIGAAGGGPRGGMTWVGEQGPELVQLPYGSTVRPAGQSRQMAMAGGGSSQPLHISLYLGGSHLGEILIDPLRKSVSSRGGNVQAVLGRR